MDYHHLSRGRQKKTVLSRVILVVFAIFFLSAAVLAVYKYKSHPDWAENIAAYRERIGIWLSERKQSVRHGAGAHGDADDQEDVVRPVNFEFYSTLQDMTSMQAEAHAEAQRNRAEKENAAKKYAASKSATIKAAATNTRDKVATGTKSQKHVKNSAVDLENDLLAAIKQTGGGK